MWKQNLRKQKKSFLWGGGKRNFLKAKKLDFFWWGGDTPTFCAPPALFPLDVDEIDCIFFVWGNFLVFSTFLCCIFPNPMQVWEWGSKIKFNSNNTKNAGFKLLINICFIFIHNLPPPPGKTVFFYSSFFITQISQAQTKNKRLHA